MEIKRNFEELVVTKRRFVIRQMPAVKQTVCAKCGESMLAIAQAAIFFGIKQSRIFQIVETGAAHFNEAEAGALMICLNSLAAVLDCDSEKKLEEKKMMKKLFCTIIAIVLAGLFASCEQLSKQNPLATKSPEPAKTESNKKPEESAKNEKHEKHWDYEENGPNKWASLNPENKLCGEGKMQSPIDITNPKTAELTDISIKFPSAEFTMTHNEHVKDIDNNGHTIQVDFEDESSDTLKIGDANYKLWQFHFHSPSEHTINGKNAAMEMHLVHKNGDNLAVIGILIEQGAEDNKAFEPIWTKLPRKGQKGRKYQTRH